MKNKRVFVSGAAGVIGRELVPRLLERGAVVLAADLKTRPAAFDPAVIYRQGDLNHMAGQELASFQPEVFIHLAATFERSAESYEFWHENFWHNVRLSHHLVSLAKDLPCMRHIVFASSYLIYDPAHYQFGEPRTRAVSLKEGDPVLPRNLTGMAKFSHEIELRFLEQFRGDDISIICARIFRGYGRGSRDVISRWVRLLLEDQPVTVYRPEGMFDYIYAADSAEGLIRLAESSAAGGIVNLGTGRARKVQEVIDILKDHFPGMRADQTGSDIAYEASQADMRRFVQSTGWSPRYDLEKAISEIIAYEKEQLLAAPGTGKALKVLISSASAKIPLVRAMQTAVKKLHPDSRVVAGDLSEKALAAHIADEFWLMPKTADTSLERIIRGCQERGINAVLPTRDGELLFWARHTERLQDAGILVMSSSADAINTCTDKLRFSRYGLDNGLPFIPSALSPQALECSRYVVKERFGAGSRTIGIGLELSEALEHGSRLDQPIYQPMIEGTEISIDAWLDKQHSVKGVVLRKRVTVVHGESQVTTTFRDVGIEAQAMHILQTLALRGPVVMQALVTGDSQLQIIECNARFGGASTTAIAAGLDSFYWSALEAAGVDPGPYPFLRAGKELTQVRVPSDIYLITDDPGI
jgi:carbamoyl-phosphate synthase large subunit